MAAKKKSIPPFGQRTWDDVPDTNPRAVIKSERNVTDVMAIRVEKASHRKAPVSGWFEIADVPNPFRLHDGSLVAEVKCLWYGLRPKTEQSWMELKINNKYQFVRRYSGKVADNIEE